MNNIFLFHGEDDFTLRRKINFWRVEFAKKYSESAISFLDGEKLTEDELLKKLEEALAPSLFSSKKLTIAKNILPASPKTASRGGPTAAGQDLLVEKLSGLVLRVPADCFLVFWQTDKLDLRLKVTKKIFGWPIAVTEFRLPRGNELNKWILAEAKRLGMTMEPQAVEKLAQFLGRDLAEEKKLPPYDLWQASNELEKLAGFSKLIKPADVEALVKPKLPDNIFLLSDLIFAGHEQKALVVLEQLMLASSADEKSSVIKIVGLLSEQLRSQILVALLYAQGKTNDEMAEILGWTPGRVYINLKLVKNLNLAKAKELLARLLKIDKAIKTSDADPRLLINLFIHKAAA